MSRRIAEGLVPRLRNGGQTDLADMAEGLLDALYQLRLVTRYFWDDDNPHIIEFDAACAQADEARAKALGQR